MIVSWAIHQNSFSKI